MKAIIKLHKYLKTQIKKIQITGKILAYFYIKIVVVGLALTGLSYTFMPILKLCTSWFGGYVCDPIGNYIVAIVSFPGYFISAIILFIWSEMTEWFLTLIIFAFSILFYYLIGYLFENKYFKKINYRSTSFLIFAVFMILLIALIIII